MKIEPHRSKFKKITRQYKKDNVLDIIDIEDTLSKNRFIPKTPEATFIYSKYLASPQASLSSSFIQTSDAIDYPSLNNNKFKINFETLKLEYSNGYAILLVDVYQSIKLIGEGSFGVVIGAIHRETKRKKAIKIIDKSNLTEIENGALDNEVKIVNSLSHPRVLKIYEVLDTTDYFFIFMELIEGGSLRDLIISRYKDTNEYLFRDSECSEIMTGLLEVLNYLQMMKIVHRDIKPENIMLKAENDLSSIALCDFGIACKLGHSSSVMEKCGTTLYMSPEMIEGKKYDHLVDSWSAGIVLYILVSGGQHPLYQKTMTQGEYENELLKKKEIAFSEHIPLLARNLFMKLCKYEPFYRYEPFKALKHPWITRSTQSQIPMTLIEEYEIKGKINEFKSMLSAPLFLYLYKSINQFQLKKLGRSTKERGTLPKAMNNQLMDSISMLSNSNSSRAPQSFNVFKSKRLLLLTEAKQAPLKKPLASRNTSKLSIMFNRSSGDNNNQLSTSPNNLNKQRMKPTHIYLKTDLNSLGLKK